MRLLHTAIKMSLVGVIASLIARFLGLEYWLTAGILAILSIHLTKRDSLIISLRRITGSLFALILSTLFFLGFGYEFLVYSVFVFIFAYAAWMLRVSEGIVPGLVLVTHLLGRGSFDAMLLLNEVLILFVSIGIALLFNIIYPTSSEKELNQHILSIDQMIRDHLYMLSLLLKDPSFSEEYYRHYSMLDKKISETIDVVELVDKDLLFANDHSYLAYFHMRKEQSAYIRHMYVHALKIKSIHPYALSISEYVRNMTQDVGIYNKAILQLKKLGELQLGYKDAPLPETRDEFEIRAGLYQILNEIESFLMVKVQFHHQYPEFTQKHLK